VDASGPIIGDRYELGALLGRGGMSEVRAGRDLRLGRDVAVKLLTVEGADPSQVRERFDAEARAVASLSHPNVVMVFDSGEHEGVPFLVMERLPGRTLADEMGAGPLVPDRACQVAREVLAALGAAHEAGIVHRDIKPSNVLLGADGHIKVADFGIAKTASAMTLTGHGILLGTPGYVAPERLAGEPATPRSDLYAVGVLLYEALSGRPPFAGDSPAGLMRAIRESRPVPLAELCPGLPTPLVRAVERAMEKDPQLRFATAAEMGAALVAPTPDAAATAVLVPPPAVHEPEPSRRRDQRRQVVGGVCLLVALTFAGTVVARSGGGPEAAAPTATSTSTPPQPFPTAAGPLAPGRYRTGSLQPPVQLTLGAGWSLAEAEVDDILALKRTSPDASGAELTVVALKRVFARDRTYQTGADYVAPGAGEPAPPNLLTWLQAHPRLRVSKPTETRIDGAPAVRVDVEAVSPYPSEVCVSLCVAIFQLDAAPSKYRLVKLEKGRTMRLYIAQVEGRTVVFSIVAPTEELGVVGPTAETVIETAAIAP
jgi:hypothetical protein